MNTDHRPDPLDYPLLTIPTLDLHSTSPVVALDLDGVLNPLGARDHLPDTAQVVDVCIPAWATADASFLVGRGWRNIYPQVVVDTAHGNWIRTLLHQDITVVWTTSWETAAPLVYGPLLGLPPLPVIVLDSTGACDGTDAKAQQLSRLFPARTLVWLDDTSHHRPYLKRHPAYPTLIPHISASTGLTQAVRDEVDAWLFTHRDGFPAHPDELAIVDSGQWRIHTTDGTLRLSDDTHTGTLLIPGHKLRARHALPARLPCDYRVDAQVGHPLTLSCNGQDIPVGVVTRIDCLQIVDRLPRGHQPLPYPDLAAQRTAQELITAALQPWTECTGIAVRDGECLGFWDGDVLLELDVSDDIAVLRVHLPPTTTTPHGQWVEIAYERTWRLQHARRDQPGIPRMKPEAATWALSQWRTWTHQHTCSHTQHQTSRYCPDCGLPLTSDL